MISLIKSTKSGNTYLVAHTKKEKRFIVLQRTKILNQGYSRDMMPGKKWYFITPKSFVLFKIVKSYNTIQEAIVDNFTEIL